MPSSEEHTNMEIITSYYIHLNINKLILRWINIINNKKNYINILENQKFK